MDKLVIDKLILVEGKYDKIRLENIVEADIFVLNGFRIFKDKNKLSTIKTLAKDRDVLILTDSDTAGYKIRVFLSKVLNGSKIINVFVPQICGKEKRKTAPSAEGFLGVEGISDTKLKEILKEFVCSVSCSDEITAAHLFELGLTGTMGASERKNALLKALGVQQNISNKFLLRILNDRFTLEQFKDFIKGE